MKKRRAKNVEVLKENKEDKEAFEKQQRAGEERKIIFVDVIDISVQLQPDRIIIS